MFVSQPTSQPTSLCRLACVCARFYRKGIEEERKKGERVCVFNNRLHCGNKYASACSSIGTRERLEKRLWKRRRKKE